MENDTKLALMAVIAVVAMSGTLIYFAGRNLVITELQNNYRVEAERAAKAEGELAAYKHFCTQLPPEKK